VKNGKIEGDDIYVEHGEIQYRKQTEIQLQ